MLALTLIHVSKMVTRLSEIEGQCATYKVNLKKKNTQKGSAED